MKEILENLRLNRTSSTSSTLQRGTLPKVELNSGVLAEFIVASVVIFFLSMIFVDLIYTLLFSIISIFMIDLSFLTSTLTLPTSLFMVMLFLGWPIFVALYLKRKTGALPKDEILKNFNKR